MKTKRYKKRWQSGSFAFTFWVGLEDGGKSKCAACGWQSNFNFFSCGGKKIKIRSVGLVIRSGLFCSHLLSKLLVKSPSVEC
jgi:hypothetical protein